jgi:Glycosyl hydrolases family 2, TIM barrel domain/Glycosyl hydrolases family 2, sugar binding domain/Glycosyl hydrolases family 2
VNRRRFVASIGTAAALKALSQARGAARQVGEEAPGNESAPNPVWRRPTIIPIPDATAGVEKPVISLNGTWKFTLNPPARFWSNEAAPAGWDDIEVPGECTMQGFEIARDTEYPFKRAVLIPADFKGKKIFLRFDGLYSYGRVWVNGHDVRGHRGGFTSWDCNITPFVTPGREAWITVGVTDETNDISWQSNYAKHYIGGILRDVRLIALPPDYVARFHVETAFDSAFNDAVLRLTLAMAFDRAHRASVEVRLKDPGGRRVSIHPASIQLSRRAPETTIRIPVMRPAKWDSEHPRLYTLEAIVKVDGASAQNLRKRFGFRKAEVRGNQLLVNGDPVKLRGGCRHDIFPTRGRSTTPALDEQDVRLLKCANFNFVRTSHYPPTEAFLDACDRHGLYIEEETAVCFVRQSFGSRAAPQDDPRYTAQFMNQFAEMIERDRDHPCVILWSLGNESQWGANLEKEYSYLKIEDRTRPVIFSYPESAPKGVKAYDIFSKHYPKFDSDFTSASIPKLNDEFGHLACYNQGTLRRDPGVRNYWGRSIREFWKGMFPAEGCLGGSIWAGLDEVFMLPGSCVGYGEWGIIDGWRREKPEYWLTKKAYSPAKISESCIENPGSGIPLEIAVRNEFNHTNLNEVRVEWRVGSERGEIRDLNVTPRAAGLLKIPGRAWQNGEAVHLKFFGPEDRLLDQYELPVGRAVWNFPPVQGPAPRILEDNRTIRVAGRHFEIVFSKATGLIRHATYKNHTILEGGPLLNLAPCALADWWLSGLNTKETSDEAVIEILGSYRRKGEFSSEVKVDVQFQIRIDGGGLITTNFKLQGVPRQANEIGVAYVLPHEADQLSWSRKALWSAYPPDHIGRCAGVAHKIRPSGTEKYRETPAWPWSEDTKDFFLFGKDDAGGRGTNDFRSQKQNIWFASGVISRTGVRARAESDATHALRAEIERDGRVRLNINSAWAYPDLDWGNECPALSPSSAYEGTARLRLTENDSIEVVFKDR